MSVAVLRARALTMALACFLGAMPRAIALDELPPQIEAPIRIAALDPSRLERDPPRVLVSTEPFRLFLSDASATGIAGKWRKLQAGLNAEMLLVAQCRAEPETCSSPAAQRFLAIVEAARAREGRARLGELNRTVNLAIRAVSDTAQHGVADRWSTPLESLSAGRGDCEDYAILKFAALRELGVADQDLRLLVVRDPLSGDHAVVSVRHEDQWLILDNRRLAMVQDIHFRAKPLFALSHAGAWSFSTQPMPLSIAARPAAGDETSGPGGWSPSPLLM